MLRVCAQLLTCDQLFATPWIVAHWAPLSMGFSRQEFWSGFPFLPPGDLPNPGIKPSSPSLAGRFFTTEPPGKPHKVLEKQYNTSSMILIDRSFSNIFYLLILLILL